MRRAYNTAMLSHGLQTLPRLLLVVVALGVLALPAGAFGGREGDETPATSTPSPSAIQTPSPAPTGALASLAGRIAFTSERDGNTEVYVMNADGSDQRRLTDNVAADRWPAWSPDGLRIAFTTYRQGEWGVYVMNADGLEQHPLRHRVPLPRRSRLVS